MPRSLLLLALCAVTVAAGAQAPKQDAPRDAAHGTPAGGRRTAEQIGADLTKAQDELRDALAQAGGGVMVDPAVRQAAAPRAVPVMKRMVAGLDELVAIDPSAKADILDSKIELLTTLSLFGDADSAAALARLAQGRGTDALKAASGQQFVAFVRNPKDQAAQLKALDEMQRLARANPKEDAVAQVLVRMAMLPDAAEPVVTKAEDILLTDLTGEYARKVAADVRGQRKLRASVGKPVEIAGTKLDGTPFSTKDWKGKVVLVDFWATWCGPCIAELPKLKKAYIDHHAKGLEVVGVSSDADAERLKEFLAKNKDMPWPQLFDPKIDRDEPVHPLVREWGLRLPTIFLIDRKGVLRTANGVEEYQELVPKLLAEKAE